MRKENCIMKDYSEMEDLTQEERDWVRIAEGKREVNGGKIIPEDAEKWRELFHKQRDYNRDMFMHDFYIDKAKRHVMKAVRTEFGLVLMACFVVFIIAIVFSGDL